MAVANLADGPADCAGPHSTDSVLEVGPGLGSQAPILAALARQVYSIELIEELSIGDGHAGWPAHDSSGRMVRSP